MLQRQMQKMRGHAGIIGLRFDAPPVIGELMPVKQHRGKRSEQPVRDILLGMAAEAREVLAGITQKRPQTSLRAAPPDKRQEMQALHQRVQRSRAATEEARDAAEVAPPPDLDSAELHARDAGRTRGSGRAHLPGVVHPRLEADRGRRSR